MDISVVIVLAVFVFLIIFFFVAIYSWVVQMITGVHMIYVFENIINKLVPDCLKSKPKDNK